MIGEYITQRRKQGIVFDTVCGPPTGPDDDPQDLSQSSKNCSSTPDPPVNFASKCYTVSDEHFVEKILQSASP